MVGTGVVVGGHPGGHHVDITPADDGIDEPVTSPAGDVVVVEAERQQIVDVIGQGQVAGGKGPGPGPRREGSRSRTTVTSGARIGPCPRIWRARAVCSTGTK